MTLRELRVWHYRHAIDAIANAEKYDRWANGKTKGSMRRSADRYFGLADFHASAVVALNAVVDGDPVHDDAVMYRPMRGRKPPHA